MSTLVTHRRSRPHADADPAAHWSQRAACSGRLAEFESSEDAARAMCEGCPVKVCCLDEALEEEGYTTRYYRTGIRGGLDPAERAALTGPRQAPAAPVGRISGDLDEAEQLLRAGRLNDSQIADATGMGRDTVGKLRRSLNLPPVVTRQTSTLQERLDRRTRAGEDGHVLWIGSPGIDVGHGRTVGGVGLAFELGHGRPAEGTVRRLCEVEGCVAWAHLADRVLRRAAQDAARTLPVPVEYLYGIQSGHWEGDERWVPAQVIRFRIVKKTTKRIFYVRREGAVPELANIDRTLIETDGEVCRAQNIGWWEPDKFLYLAPPEIGVPSPATGSSLADLKAAMVAAHPDRGGDSEAFTAARDTYEQARRITSTAGAQQ